MVALPDADIAGQLTFLEDKVEGPGKRRAKRAVFRLQTIQAVIRMQNVAIWQRAAAEIYIVPSSWACSSLQCFRRDL